MSKIDKYFGGTSYNYSYNYQDKNKNISDNVRYMLARSITMFHYVGLPDTIPQEELERMLQTTGCCAVAEVNGELYALNGSLGGEGDAYNRPTTYTVANHYLKLNKTYKINEDCVIINNDSMYQGILPIFEKYCYMLNESEITIILATINKRVQMLLSANDDNTVQSAKQFLKDIEDGKTGVIAESKLFDSLKVNNSATGTNVSLTELFEMNNYIRSSMYNEIGLGSNNNMKREQITTVEVESNTDSYYPYVDNMLMCRRKALEKINEMFGTDIQVEFNSSWDYRFKNGEPIDTLKTSDEDVEPTDEPIVEPTETDIEESAGETNVNDETSETRGNDEQSDEPTEVSENTEEPVDETEEQTEDSTSDSSSEHENDNDEQSDEDIQIEESEVEEDAGEENDNEDKEKEDE